MRYDDVGSGAGHCLIVFPLPFLARLHSTTYTIKIYHNFHHLLALTPLPPLPNPTTTTSTGRSTAMSQRAVTIGGGALLAGVGYYLYAAGGDPKVAEKKFEGALRYYPPYIS